MNCKFCQSLLEEESSVCPVCGKDNDAEEIETVEEPVEALLDENAVTKDTVELPVEEIQEALQEETPKKKNLGKKIGVAVGAVAVVAAIAAGCVLYAPTWKMQHAMGKGDIYQRASYTQEIEKKLVKNDKQIVANMNGETLTNGELQIYYRMQYIQFLNTYGQYVSVLGLDTTKPLDEQICQTDENGQEITWQQFFLKNALDYWAYCRSMAREAEKAGMTLDETTQAQLDSLEEDFEANAQQNNFASADEMLAVDFGKGASMENYKSYAYNYFMGNKYFEMKLNAFSRTAEDVEAYYDAHTEDFAAQNCEKNDMPATIDVRHILIKPATSGTDESGKAISTDEDWAAAEKKANEVYQQWKDGEATEESFDKLASEYNADGSSLYTDVTPGRMVAEFNDWCFDAARKTGDNGIVKTQFGYHIMYFVSASEKTYWYAMAEQMLMEDQANELSTSILEANPYEVNYLAIQIGEVEPASAS